MTTGAKHTILRMLLILTILTFLAPFIVQSDFSGMNISVKGIGLIAGARSPVSIQYNWVDKESGARRTIALGNMKPSVFAVLAAVCILAALISTFIGMRNKDRLAAMLLIGAIVLFIIMKVTIDRDAEQQGYGQVLCRLDWAWGYWVGCAFVLLSAIASLLPAKRAPATLS